MLEATKETIGNTVKAISDNGEESDNADASCDEGVCVEDSRNMAMPTP